MNPDIAKAFLHYSLGSVTAWIISAGIALISPGASAIGFIFLAFIGTSLYRFKKEESLKIILEFPIAIFSVVMPYFGIIYPIVYYLKNGDLN